MEDAEHAQVSEAALQRIRELNALEDHAQVKDIEEKPGAVTVERTL